MSINISRRFSWKSIPMVAAAAIASAALAASALASPTNTVKIDTTNHTAQFGAICTAGAAPTNTTADWQEDAAKTTQALSVSGNLCLQKTKDTYRVELREYYLDASLGHQLIATSDSRPLTGNNGALNQSAVNLQLPRVFRAAVHHGHVQLQKQDSTGAWTDVAGGLALVDY